MTEPEEFEAFVTMLRAEHQRLDATLRSTEEEWLRMLKLSERGVAMDELTRKVETLRDELAKHFREEEQGGCLEEAVSQNRDPAQSHELARLEHEHPWLLDDLDKVLQGLRDTAHDDVARLTEVRDAFHRFGERLRAHEAAENKVLAKGFGADVD